MGERENATRARGSARDEVAQPPRLLAGAALQLRVAEIRLSPLLGGDHVVFIDRETGFPGQGEKDLQVNTTMQLPVQIGVLPAMVEKGVELIQTHGEGKHKRTPV
jgi:hypothetical protein